MSLNVRKAQTEDAESIVGILNPIIESRKYSVLDTPVSAEMEREFIRRFPPRGVFHVAERASDERAVGFQTLEPYATYTHAFDHVGVVATFVDLNCRGGGVGRHLSEATFHNARDKGFEKIFTFVRADNPDALQFYLKLGFRTVGTAQKQAKIDGMSIDEVIIEKFL